MIENKLVQKMVRHVLNPKRKQLIDNSIMHPEREWFLGITIGILICALGAWWSVTSYITYSNVSVQDKESEAPVVYRASMVKEVVSDFSNREVTYNNLLLELKNQNSDTLTVTPIATSSVESIDLSEEVTTSTSTEEVRTDRSTEVPYPENQVEPSVEGVDDGEGDGTGGV